MKKYLFFAAVSIMACLSGCAQIEPSSPEIKKDETPSVDYSQVFTATREEMVDNLTKASFSGTKLSFEVGDFIIVTDGSAWSKFVATSVSAEGVASFALVSGQTPLKDDSTYKAYYPHTLYNATTKQLELPQQSINNNGEVTSAATAAGKSTSNYTASVFKSNPMYAETTGNVLNFKNICGLIKFHVTHPSDVTVGSTSDYALSQIIVYDNEKMLFGPFSVNANNEAEITMQDPGFKRAAARNDNAKWVSCVNDFYFALPPATYSAMDLLAQSNKKAIQNWMLKNGSSLIVERNKVYTINLNLDDIVPTEQDLTGVGVNTANCYVIKNASGSKFRFRATRGVNQDLIRNIDHVGLLWRAQMSTSQADADDLGDVVIKDVSYDHGYIKFTATGNQGNASIAAYDSSNNIIWSWHIWGINESNGIIEQALADGTVLMDRNLGALYSDIAIPATKNVETAASSRFSAGYIYQWGRKDPFPGRANNGATRLFWKACSSDRNFSIQASGSPVSVETATQNPTKFYGSTTGVWCSDSTLPTWDGEQKSIYDPCPAGYRVWRKNLFTAGTANYELNIHLISGTTYQNVGYNYKTKDTNGKYFFFPVNGQANNQTGAWSSAITQSRIWVRSVDADNKTGFFTLTNNTVSNKTATLGGGSYSLTQPQCSSYGMCVRCEKIQ